jgi:DNA helicase HerA-like ATPase
VGDPDKPKLVFFFDEAHLLFDDAPKALVDKVEQVARLIRSKGVGVYFVTQSPDDIPEDILGQLGNLVQHALRAYTARDQQALRRAAQTYRVGPNMNTEEAILQVGVGEAVTSFLGDKGVPGFATRTLIRPPQSQLGPIQDAQRTGVIQASDLEQKYRHVLDRVSAFEILNQRARAAAEAAELGVQEHPAENMDDPADRRVYNSARRIGGAGSARRLSSTSRGRTAETGSIGEALGRALVKELSGTTGRRIIRGVLGGLFKRR